MHEPWDPDRRATSVAARQHAVISHRQAVAAGLSNHQIDGRVRAGRWRRVCRGVYVVAGSASSWQQRAWIALLAPGHDDVVVSHLTAGAVLGLTAPSLLPHVTVPPGRSTRSGVAKVHRGVVAVQDRTRRDGFPTTTAARLLVDLGGMLDRPTFEGVLDDAFCRRRASPATVLDAAARIGGGRSGLVLVRQSVEVWSESIRPDSVAEVRLLRRLGELGLTGLVTQHEVVDGGRFVARLDLAAPARKRALEYDGVAAHGPRRWSRDESRYEDLRRLGWEVEAVTKFDLLPGEGRLPALVARWLAT